MTNPFRHIRNDFPILNQSSSSGVIYLDNAATTQKPQAVLDAITGYYSSCNANVYRAIHQWGEESTRQYEEARRKVCRFIGASDSTEIIFTSGTTDAINLAADSFCRRYVAEGDEILLSEMEHHSNIVPWQLAAEKYGCVLKYIPVTGGGDLDVKALRTLWSRKTKLLTVCHMSNFLGTINDVKRIIGEAHARGIPVLLDAAQSVPHMPVDVQDLDCDFLAFSGHKMYGPTGIGVLYGKKESLEELPPWKGGGEMIRNVFPDHSEWNAIPHKFEAGTPNIAGAVGLGAAMDYLTELGMDNIRQREEILTRKLLEGLESIPEITVIGDPAKKGGIVSFIREGAHAHDLTQYMDSRGIALRAGHHCAHILARKMGARSTSRASLSFYNTEEEIDVFLKELKNAGKNLI